MAEKFLYYTGAGASAQALPTVKPIYDASGKCINDGFVNRLNQFRYYLDNFKPENAKSPHGYIKALSTLISTAVADSQMFHTIDTLAKFYYIKNRDSFRQLKAALTAFFVLHQHWEQKVDLRYLSWLTSIMSDSDFPDNIKIINWNYDYQFQIAANIFQQESFTASNNVFEYTSPLISYWPAVGQIYNKGYVKPVDLSLLHINGLAGSYFNHKTRYYDNFFLNTSTPNQESFIRHLAEFNDGHLFRFAWETGEHQDFLISAAKDMVKDTTIVVVIGYSFPFFNRDMDKMIFEELTSTGTLRKIYFQDPFLDGSFLRAQFNLDESIEIIHIDKIDSFYIPFEL